MNPPRKNADLCDEFQQLATTRHASTNTAVLEVDDEFTQLARARPSITSYAPVIAEEERAQQQALLDAIRSGDEDTVQQLLAAGVRVASSKKNPTCLQDDSPLCKAALQGHSSIVRMLLIARADANFVHMQTGQTIVERVSTQNGVQVSKLLQEARTPMGRSVLFIARAMKSSTVAKLIRSDTPPTHTYGRLDLWSMDKLQAFIRIYVDMLPPVVVNIIHSYMSHDDFVEHWRTRPHSPKYASRPSWPQIMCVT